MNKIKVIKHTKPDLKIPKFNVDGKLKKKLDNFELTKCINKSHFALFLGKAGSGKTSLAVSLLSAKSLFRNVFHEIFLFCPENSRNSIQNNFWESNLQHEQMYDELSLESLREVYMKCQANADIDCKSIIIIDDNQKFLKDPQIYRMLLHIVNNRRHALTTVWLLAQNYFSIPKQIRDSLTNAFIMKVNKSEFIKIFDELVDSNKESFDHIIENIAYKQQHDFIFVDINTSRIFNNWDEIRLEPTLDLHQLKYDAILESEKTK